MRIKTPKDVFVSQPANIEEHQRFVDHPLLVKSIHAAFAQYCWTLSASGNIAQAWDANNKRQGAKEFIETFLLLAETSAPAQKPQFILEPDPLEKE